MKIKKFCIFCETDQKFEAVWSLNPPTTCISDVTHSVNLQSVSEIGLVSARTVTSTTQPFTVTSKSVLADSSTGNVTITLPSATRTDGSIIVILKTSASNSVIVTATDLINGGSSITLTDLNEFSEITSNGTTYTVVTTQPDFVPAEPSLIPLTAKKGDLLTDDGTGTGLLDIGIDNQVLMADSTALNGVDWKYVIDDTSTSLSTAWSSTKVASEISAGGGGSSITTVDHTGLAGNTAKTNSTVSGVVEKYTANGSILEGQPVAVDIDSSIKVSSIDSATQIWQIVGVATNASATGGTVEVCTKGFCKARRTTTSDTTSLKLLDSTTDGTNPVGLGWTFKDSGGSSDYSNNENYDIIFDAQLGGTWTLTFNSFTFEHTDTKMYDRLGIQSSTDGTNFYNVSIPWMQTSAITSVPWGTSFAGSAWNSNSSNNGWIVPTTTTRAILLGWNQQNPTTISARYIKFTFISDTSTQKPGWDITLTSSNFSASATVLPYGTPLYLDTSGAGSYNLVSTTGTNIIGYSASSDSSGDSIYCYIP